MKKISVAILVILGIASYLQNNPSLLSSRSSSVQQSRSQLQASTAYQKKLSDIQLQGSGIVSRILSNDNQGSRHQKFILRLPSGKSLLVAHNIDLAPEIKALKKGDTIEFYGEYEWNSKGGVVHWTHHDPAQRHIDGWLKHKGRLYQ